MTVTVDEIVQLRVGGLPVETARDLASPGALEWAEQVLRARTRVARLRGAACDQLAEHVRVAPDGVRKELVQIRRAVFNGRRADRAIAALPSGLTEAVSAIIEPVRHAEAELAELEDSGRARFPEWLVNERRHLASLLTDEDFSDGLAVAVPGAGRLLRDYPRKGVVAKPNKQMRKCERSLMSYAMRAAAKASPFSTFTPTALTTFTSGTPSWEHLPSRPRRHSRWSIYPVARALGNLREDRRRLHGLPLRLSRTVQPRSDGGLDVVRAVYDYKDSHRGEDYATCEQSVVRLRQSEVCRIVTEMLQEGVLVFEEVVAALAERAGLTQERAGEALARLVRLGLVEVDGLDLHPHTAHRAGTARRTLCAAGDDDAGLARALDCYEQAASLVGDMTGAEREQAVARVRDAVEELYRSAGLEAQTPRTVVYEDCALGRGVYRGPQLRWNEEECCALGVLATLLDPTQTDRALMRGYFIESVGEGGRCTDVAGFLRSFDADLYDSHKTRTLDPQGKASEDPWLRWGDAWRWEEARRALTALIESEEEDLDLMPVLAGDSDLLRGLDLPRHRYRHLFLFAQVLPEDSAGSLVVNRIFGHAGFGLSRFAYMHGTEGARVARDQEERARRSGVRLAEVSGGAAFTNLNLHAPLLDTEIIQPGDPGGSSAPNRVGLDGLVLEDRPEESRLALVTSEGEEVQPAYLGYLVLSATPLPTQLLSLLAPASNVTTSFVPDLPEDAGIRVLPRVRIGSLIMRRRTVQIPTTLLPDSDPATPEGYLEWVQWWRDTGLPEHCYVSLATRHGRPPGKPRYLDVSGLVNLAVSSHEWSGQDGWLNVAEALPDLSETVINREDDHRIHEVVLGFDLTNPVTEGAVS